MLKNLRGEITAVNINEKELFNFPVKHDRVPLSLEEIRDRVATPSRHQLMECEELKKHPKPRRKMKRVKKSGRKGK